MATVKLSALAAIAAVALSATDVMPITDADAGTPTTYKVTLAQIRTALLAGGSGYTTSDVLKLGAAPPSSGSVRIDGGTITSASSPLINAIATWNDAAVTHTGILVNVTNTASAAASLLIDLQVGGVSQWKVSKLGTGTLAGGLTVNGTTSLQAVTVTTMTASGVVSGSAYNIGAATLATYSSSEGVVNIGGGGGTLNGGYHVRIGYFNAGVMAAGSAAMNAVTEIDATNNRFVFYSGGNRYYVTGTLF